MQDEKEDKIKKNKESDLNSKNFIKMKEEYEMFLKENNTQKKQTINIKNILKPFFKIFLTLIISLIFINSLNNKMGDYKYIQGSWIDENNNYYEIKNKVFQMNSGQKDNPFYEGNIVNVIKDGDSITLLIKGIKYKIDDTVGNGSVATDTESNEKRELFDNEHSEVTLDTSEKKKFVYDKDMELIFKIKNYTEELEKAMIGNLGTEDFSILRISK